MLPDSPTRRLGLRLELRLGPCSLSYSPSYSRCDSYTEVKQARYVLPITLRTKIPDGGMGAFLVVRWWRLVSERGKGAERMNGRV